MAKRIQKVTMVGDGGATTLFQGKRRRKKKVSEWLRPTEKVVRQYIKAERRCWSYSLRKWRKNTRKKGDRWVFDSLPIYTQAHIKACNAFFRGF